MWLKWNIGHIFRNSTFFDISFIFLQMFNFTNKSRNYLDTLYIDIKQCSRINWFSGASLVAQWLRIHLPMQGTRGRALVQEDPTCRGATKPVRHNYWGRVPQLLKPARIEPVLRNKSSHRNEEPAHATKSSLRSPQLEKACAQQGRPNAAKNE